MTPKLYISEDVQVADGTLVKLKRFSEILWVVKFGWYQYNNRQYRGWYFLAVPSQNILPVNEIDLRDISIVSGKLVETEPEVPQTPQEVPERPPCPGPINPEYIPAFVSKADKELYDSAFISVPNLAAMHAINPHTLHDGKIVRVNDVEGKPKYFIWNATDKTWDTFEFTPSVSTRPGEKVISVDEGIIWSTLTISIELIEDTPYIILNGIDGIEIARVDATMFTESGSLESVTVEDRYIDGVLHKVLVMTFRMADGTITTVECDLTEAMSIYSAEVDGGLKLANFAFSIDNTVEPSSGLNSDINLEFGTTVVANTVKYNNHGLICGYKQISISMPSLIGQVGAKDYSKLLTYAEIDNTGQFTGQAIDIVTSISDVSTDQQIPTAKAVYTSVVDHETTWVTL